jgi:hypothetical protein
MKEYPESNYLVTLTAAEASIDLRIGEFLPGSYTIGVNRLVEIAVIPWLPRSPWPPPFPRTWDAFTNRDEAARYVLASGGIVVAPGEREIVEREVIVFPEHSEAAHTVFWYPPANYEDLVHEIERRLREPVHDRDAWRLDELGEGAIAALLRNDLPTAALTDYARRILCLAPSR